VNRLADDLARALDPVALAGRLGLAPDAWQADVLRSGAPRILLNCCRQSGKSTVAAMLALHTALYVPGSLTLLVSPSLRQSQELFRRAVDFYRRLSRPVPPEAETALRLELETGSRIVSLPGSETTVRGFSGVGLIVVDEAAQVHDSLYFALRPMLAVSGGRLVLSSTPYGARGFFYEAWRSAEPWERYEVPAASCPRISAEFLEEERRAHGEWWFRQEYECSFLDAQTQAFARDDIERAFAEEVRPWDLLSSSAWT
jgi:hypothetical protein